MATVLAPTLIPDKVVNFSIRPGTLGQFLLLGIPEMWVLDLPRHRLTFLRLARQGQHKGTYQPTPRSRAFPFLFLIAREVLERLDDPETDDTAFHENCRAWAKSVLVPRRQSM